MTVQEWMASKESIVDAERLRRYRAKCSDGTVISFQGGKPYFKSEQNADGAYLSVELSMPVNDELSFYSDGIGFAVAGKRFGVYEYVPIEVAEEIALEHGGITGREA